MDNSEDFLKNYIERMLNIQQENTQEKPLTEEELKAVALQTGMSEEEWEASRKLLAEHIKAGDNYLKFGNWEAALLSFEQALALHPHKIEAHYGVAKAYIKQWQKEEKEVFLKKAQRHIKTILRFNPAHQATIQLNNEIWQTEEGESYARKSRKWLWIGAFLLFIIIVGSGTLMTYNQVIQQKEEVKAQWAKVELEYERRLELIPKIAKIAQNHNQSLAQELEKMDRQIKALENIKELKGDELKTFAKQQEAVKKLITEAMQSIETNQALEKQEVFLTLQDQVEGTENRIKVVKTRFNKKVKEYNTKIQMFPVSLLGFATIDYYNTKK